MFPLKFTGTFSEKLFLYDCSIGRHVLGNVGDGIARALDVRRGKRHAVRVDREHAVAVDDVVPIQPGRPQLFAGRAGHALMDHRPDHLPVRHFLRTYRRHVHVPFCPFRGQGPEKLGCLWVKSPPLSASESIILSGFLRLERFPLREDDKTQKVITLGACVGQADRDIKLL